jgi:hypothetical protein
VRVRHADGSTALGVWVEGAPRRISLDLSLPSDVWAWRSGGARGYREGESVLLRGGRNRLELDASGAPVLISVPRTEVAVGRVVDL